MVNIRITASNLHKTVFLLWNGKQECSSLFCVGYLFCVTQEVFSISFNSAGFYDLSDGGSCSLSNSCTSVFSESISSSHASLLPNSQHPTTRLSIFDYRPKSADETTVHSQFQPQGVYTSDGCRIKACPDISGTPTRSRPRPVSTGNYCHWNPLIGISEERK